MSRILLVIPCYNEEKRLKSATFLKNASKDLHFLFVDDGSKDNTWNIIQEITSKNSSCYGLKLERNQGKGEAVRQGMLKYLSDYVDKNYDWIGFLDADLAIPLSEIPYIIQYGKDINVKSEAIFACRVLKLGSEIERSYLRHYVGRLFAAMVNFYLSNRNYDSQCGAKVFSPNVIHEAFDQPFTSKWVFDLEICIRLKQRKIVEAPLRVCHDIEGSKVSFLKDTFRVLKDIFLIKRRYQG